MTLTARIAALLFLIALTPITTAAASNLKVVASIKPVHSLVASVMGDIGSPHLIVRGAASPHGYALKPSDARAISDADTIFWIGPGLEGFLEKSLQTLGGNARVVRLGPDGREAPADTHGHTHSHDAHETDLHIWLDTGMAADMVRRIADALSAIAPQHRAQFDANKDRTLGIIAALESELRVILTPFRDERAVALHDAYGHFTEHFELQPMIALSLTPQHPPGAARVAAVRDQIVRDGVRCVFAEPQFSEKLIRVIADGTGAKMGRLDPLGASLTEGPALYLELMRALALDFSRCMKH
tara:strand:+ start:97495 stop:98391 length:897 start_codon:yes stop_codon:yes gene_type:complete